MLPWKHRGKLLTLMIRLVRSLSHLSCEHSTGQLGQQKKGHKRWPLTGDLISRGLLKIHRVIADGNIPTESLSEMLGQVSENSVGQIDDLVGEFQRLREKLRSDGERIQREIEEYSELSQMVMQLTKTISESVEKVRAFGGSTAH